MPDPPGLAELPPGLAEAFGEPFGAAHRRQFTSIVTTRRQDREPPVPAADAARSLRTITAVYRSAGLVD